MFTLKERLKTINHKLSWTVNIIVNPVKQCNQRNWCYIFVIETVSLTSSIKIKVNNRDF